MSKTSSNRPFLSEVLESIRAILPDTRRAVAAIPVNPVPASRPRVTRWGTYYSPRYKTWKEAAAAALDVASVSQTGATTAPLLVVVEHLVQRPKTTEREYPVGDVDNYSKASLDCVTQSEEIWNDDDQIVLLIASKRYATPNEKPGTYVDVYEVEAS